MLIEMDATPASNLATSFGLAVAFAFAGGLSAEFLAPPPLQLLSVKSRQLTPAKTLVPFAPFAAWCMPGRARNRLQNSAPGPLSREHRKTKLDMDSGTRLRRQRLSWSASIVGVQAGAPTGEM